MEPGQCEKNLNEGVDILTQPRRQHKYQFEKHGRCFIKNEIIATEDDYYCRIQSMPTLYDVNQCLKSCEIMLGNFYFLNTIHNCLRRCLTKNAYIECVYVYYDRIDPPFLSRIILDMDSKFELIDCDKLHQDNQQTCNNERVFTNLNDEELEIPVYYPKDINDAVSLSKCYRQFSKQQTKKEHVIGDGKKLLAYYEEYKLDEEKKKKLEKEKKEKLAERRSKK